jgi:hypothetical protein
VLGERDYLISMIAIAPARDGARLAELIDAGLTNDGDACAAAGELPHGAGAVVRMLAPSASAAALALRRGWAAARGALADLPLPERRK